MWEQECVRACNRTPGGGGGGGLGHHAVVAQQLPEHEAVLGQELAPEAQEAVEVRPVALQPHQQPVPRRLSHAEHVVVVNDVLTLVMG